MGPSDRQPTSGSRLEIVPAGDVHAPGIAAFFREVWDPTATSASVIAAREAGRLSNQAEPGVPTPTWLALQNGVVVGYVSSIPVRWWDGSAEWPAYWIKGLMVLPAFRNGPIGYALLKAAVARLPRSAGLAAALPARRLFTALGFRDLGAIPNWVRPLAPAKMIRRLPSDLLASAGPAGWTGTALRLALRTGTAPLVAWLGGWALRGASAVARIGAGPYLTGPFDPTRSEAELGQLWARARPHLGSGAVRDPGHLLSRYPSKSEDPYVWVAARRGTTLEGVAILRRPRQDTDVRLQGVNVSALADMLYSPVEPNVGLALLGEVERAARILQADAILASASSVPLTRLLRRQCYLAAAGNVHLLVRDASAGGSALGTTLADWYLSRGDGNSDEAF